jgi:hypothetical protein
LMKRTGFLPIHMKNKLKITLLAATVNRQTAQGEPHG